MHLCRVPFFLALGKDVFCRVLFFGTQQNASLPSAFFLALGKDVFCRVPFFGTLQNASLPSAFFWQSAKWHCAEFIFWHSAKCVFAECLFSGTRQICILPSAIFRHTAKCVFAECLFSGTRQRGILPSAIFWHSAKYVFAECLFFSSANYFFKTIFEALNEFKWKTFQLQSCITSQDLQSLFWSFLHLTKRQ